MDKQTIWVMYYATITGLTMHPGYSKPGTPTYTLDELASIADQMLEITKERFPCP